MDTPTSRVRSAAQGYVEISGIGRTGGANPNQSPLTLQSSVWWYYRIEERQGSDKKSDWHVIKTDTSNTRFVLSDSTGHCLVDPEGAEVFPSVRKVWYGDDEWPISSASNTRFFSWGRDRYRYTEHRIPSDSTLNVIGDFRTVGGSNNISIEQVTTKLLRDWKSNQAELLHRFDKDSDGVISEIEWANARLAARDKVLRELASAPAQPSLNLLAKPKDDRPFLIAGIDLHKVARRARLETIGVWLCCTFLAGLLAWLLIHS